MADEDFSRRTRKHNRHNLVTPPQIFKSEPMQTRRTLLTTQPAVYHLSNPYQPHSTFYNYSTDQITCQPSFVTLYTAAVGKAWSLVGSPRNGQAALHLFQKTLTLLAVHSYLQSTVDGFVTDNAGCCVRSASPLTTSPPRRQVSDLFATVLSASVNIGSVAYYGAVKCRSGSRQLRDLALQVFLIKEYDMNAVHVPKTPSHTAR